MQTKEELLQYLRNNYKNAGHPLYYSGTNKINFKLSIYLNFTNSLLRNSISQPSETPLPSILQN